LADRVETLEDLYENQIKPIVTDPNGNIRDVHTTIHANASDANLPTCGAVYQYGKGISDALNSKIDSLANALNGRIDGLANGLSDLNNALNGLSSSISSIANDVANLKNSSGGSGGSGGSDTTWNVVSQSWSQFRGEGASNGSYKNLSSSNTSLLGNISGEGTSYNVPQFTVSVAANGTYGDYKCVDIGETFTCTNTSTNVSKSYIPLRLVVTYEGTRHSDGGTEPGGTYWQNVTAQVWYKEANYTLTSQDISAINAAASAFAASRSLGYDSGNI
jgi:hypothetical protein